jgi:hypothetical protein
VEKEDVEVIIIVEILPLMDAEVAATKDIVAKISRSLCQYLGWVFSIALFSVIF